MSRRDVSFKAGNVLGQVQRDIERATIVMRT
jgi:hypothetical protein